MLSLTALLYFFTFFSLFLTKADIYLGKEGILPIAPTVFVIIMFVPILGIAFLRDFSREPKLEKIMFIVNGNMKIISAFVALVILSLTLSLLPGAYWRESARWIFLIGYEFLIFFFALFIPIFSIAKQRYHFFLLAALLIIVSSILYELYDPGFFSTVKGRAAGIPGNSNLSALVVAFICSALLKYDFERHKIFDISVLIIAGLGSFFTLSRSGLIEYFIILACYFAFNFSFSRERRFRFSLKRFLTLFIGLGFAVIFLITLIPKIMEESNLFANTSTQKRLSLLTGGEDVEDSSGESRYNAILESIDLINEAPIFGHGTARSRTMTELPHNMYLNQWVNNGILGVAFYVYFLVISYLTFRRRKFLPGQVFMLVTFVGSFFSHNILDHRPFLILLGMMATLSLEREKI